MEDCCSSHPDCSDSVSKISSAKGGSYFALPGYFAFPKIDVPRWLKQRCLLMGLSLVLWLLFTVEIGISPSFAAESLPLEGTRSSPEQPIPSRSVLDANDISSEKINQFVQAYLQVLELIERREGELQGAETDSESLRVQQEIEAEAYALIETTGLTWQEYVQLLGLANSDPEFGERIAIQLQDATS